MQIDLAPGVRDAKQLPDIVPLEFWTELEPDPASSDPTKLREVDWCRYARRGSINATTEQKVARLKKSLIGHWDVLGRFYDAWKDKRTANFEGIPLDAWPGISKSAVEVLRKFHILSVEHLADATDEVLVRTGVPSIREMQRRAKHYLGARDHVAAAESRAEQERENERLRSEIADLRGLVEQHARNAADAVREQFVQPKPDTADPDVVPAPARRGPGRPPRAASAD